MHAAGIVTLFVFLIGVCNCQIDSWKYTTSYPEPSFLNSIAYGNGTWVAVGRNSAVIKSQHGTDWVQVTPANVSLDFTKVNYVNGNFLLYSSNLQLITPDASPGSFTKGTAFNGNIASGNGISLAIDNSFLIYQSTDGLTWKPVRPQQGMGFAYVDVAFGGGTFLITSVPIPGFGGDTSLIFQTTNATEFTSSEPPVATCSGPIEYWPQIKGFLLICQGVIYARNATDEKWNFMFQLPSPAVKSFACNDLRCMIVANNKIYESVNGTEWEETNSVASGEILESTTDGVAFVAVGSVLSNQYRYPYLSLSLAYDQWTNVSNSLGIINILVGAGNFVAFNTQAGYIMVSQDGVTWQTMQRNGTLPSFIEVVPGQITAHDYSYVAVAEFGIGTTSYRSTLYYSFDLVDWTLISLTDPMNFARKGTFGNQLWVFVGVTTTGDTPLVTYSADGTKWTQNDIDLEINPEAICYSSHSSTWIIASFQGLAISTDLKGWSLVKNAGYKCGAVAADNNGNVISLCNCGIYRSTDGGYTWNGVDSPSNLINDLAQVTYDSNTNSFFIINGELTTVQCTPIPSMFFASTDGGQTWNMVYYSLTTAISSISVVPPTYAVLTCMSAAINTTSLIYTPATSNAQTSCAAGGSPAPVPKKDMSGAVIATIVTVTTLSLLLVLVAVAMAFYLYRKKKYPNGPLFSFAIFKKLFKKKSDYDYENVEEIEGSVKATHEDDSTQAENSFNADGEFQATRKSLTSSTERGYGSAERSPANSPIHPYDQSPIRTYEQSPLRDSSS